MPTCSSFWCQKSAGPGTAWKPQPRSWSRHRLYWILLMDPNFGFRSPFSAPFTLPTAPTPQAGPPSQKQRPASPPLLLTSCASLSRVPPLAGSHFPWGEMRAESCGNDVAASWTCHQPGRQGGGGRCPSLLPTSLCAWGLTFRELLVLKVSQAARPPSWGRVGNVHPQGHWFPATGVSADTAVFQHLALCLYLGQACYPVLLGQGWAETAFQA